MKLLFKKISTFLTIFVFLMLAGVWPVLGEEISTTTKQQIDYTERKPIFENLLIDTYQYTKSNEPLEKENINLRKENMEVFDLENGKKKIKLYSYNKYEILQNDFYLINTDLKKPIFSFQDLFFNSVNADTYSMENSKDGYIGNYAPNTSYGTDEGWQVYRNTGTNDTSRQTVGFTLPTGMAAGTIDQINLYSYVVTVYGNHTVDVHESTRNFTEACTWNKYDGTNNWTTAGGDYSATIIDSVNMVNAVTDYWAEFGIMGTSSVNSLTVDWGDTVNLILKHSTEGAVYNYSFFRSKEYAADTTKRPYIEIIYTPEEPEPTPALMYMTYPDDISIVHKFTTQYNASGTIIGYTASDEYHPFKQFLFWVIVEAFIAFVLIYFHLLYEKKKKRF